MDMDIKIRTLREEKKLSQTKLAKLIDTTSSTVCDWEHNRYYPDVNMIRKLCDVLDTTPTYLIDTNIIENQENDKIDNKTLARLLAYYIKLNNNDRDTVNQLVESLSKK